MNPVKLFPLRSEASDKWTSGERVVLHRVVAGALV